MKNELIDYYSLMPHPEGGWYKETYKSNESIKKSGLPKRFKGKRFLSTSIYFLLEKGDFSAFHKIKSDECWHFYSGGALLIYLINERDEMETVKLGNNFKEGELFQYVVPSNCWFASVPDKNSSFSFVGCTVSPGFDFDDFELANKKDLIKKYPQHKKLISKFCR